MLRSNPRADFTAGSEYRDELMRWTSALTAGGMLGYSLLSLRHKDSQPFFLKISYSDFTCSRMSFGTCKPIWIVRSSGASLRCRQGKFLEGQQRYQWKSPYIDRIHGSTRLLRKPSAVSSNVMVPSRHRHVTWR